MRIKNKCEHDVSKLIILLLDSLMRMRMRNNKSVSEKVERLGCMGENFNIYLYNCYYVN